MRAGWMRPSSSSFSSVSFAISPPHAVERRQDHRRRRLVDDEIDARQVLQCADVASLAADDPALHVVRGQRDHRYRRLGRMAGGKPLHRDGEDAPDTPLGISSRLLLDLADRPRGLVPASPSTSRTRICRAWACVKPRGAPAPARADGASRAAPRSDARRFAPGRRATARAAEGRRPLPPCACSRWRIRSSVRTISPRRSRSSSSSRRRSPAISSSALGPGATSLCSRAGSPSALRVSKGRVDGNSPDCDRPPACAAAPLERPRTTQANVAAATAATAAVIRISMSSSLGGTHQDVQVSVNGFDCSESALVQCDLPPESRPSNAKAERKLGLAGQRDVVLGHTPTSINGR